MAEIPTFALAGLAFVAGLGLGVVAGAKFAAMGFIGLIQDGTLQVRKVR